MNSNINKKILLINPPFEDFYQTKIRQEPLGLAYLSAVLRRAGFETILLDALADSGRKTVELPPPLKYMRAYYPAQDLSPFKLFTNFYHFGQSWEWLEDEISRINPDLIGITSNFTPYFPNVVQVARICKRILPQVPVVVGGHHVTASPGSALTEGCFDRVVLGEGEMTFLALAETILTGSEEELRHIPGTAFLDGDFVQMNSPAAKIENPDDLPYPDAPAGLSRKMLLTSRGCPMNCNFCTIQKVMGKKNRLRSVDSVLDEIAHWETLGYREIDLEDDNLLFYPKRAENLFQKIIDRFGERHFRLAAMNGISAEKLSKPLLQLMAQAGFEWLNLPLVSGNETIQSQIHRHQSRDHFLEIVRMAADFNLKIVGYLILGLPDDSLENMIADILTLAQERVLIGPSIFYPPPGSAVFEACVARNYIQPNDFIRFRSTAFSVETENFTRTELVTLFRVARLINYVKEIIDSGELGSFSLVDWLYRQPSPELESCTRLNAKQIGGFLLQEFFLNKSLKGMKLKERFGNHFKYEMIEYKISHQLIVRLQQQLQGLTLKGVTSKRETRI